MDELLPRPPNSSPLTPLGFLDRAAVVYGDCPSLVYGDISYTWLETRDRCLKLASSISRLGLGRRDVVSVIAPNIPAMYELHFAIPMAGAVLHSINTRLDARTVSVILGHSESKLVFVDYQSISVISEAISLLPPNSKVPLLVLIGGEEKEESAASLDFHCTFEDMMIRGDPSFEWVWPESEWDPLTLNYTSGTTSAPKGVVHSHRGTFIVTFDSLVEWSVPKQPVLLWTLPMFHANGWSFTWGMAAVGGTNICLRKFDAHTIYSAIDRHGVTHMCGAPVVLNLLSNSADARPLKFPVQIMTAGAPPPAAVLLKTESLGFRVTHGYGLTETGGLVVSCAWKSKWNKLSAPEIARLKARQGVRTVGMTEVDVVDPETGASVKRDGTSLGEIVLRGGCLMLGYLKNPEATSKSLGKDGWFYTGDVGVMYPDGYLEIKDRSKDVIISGGENLSSVEVESILYTHPLINEASVVARPDEFWGETPCAFVSLRGDAKKGEVKEEEIIEFCRSKLAHYMVPKTVVFLEELPKTATGKIQKFVLREMAKKLGSADIRSRM
ncbi:hypothetical protein DCAR_0313138 [Daucus carota subsp. sativus]|uniref:4-coumarate--CoA ligase n=1 Tax=Daucus carota subsp. sativus TaxID=79200 RepID=A0AAF0WS88_DAUCS|nr:PREDICTED: probable acyl-activating enzyme 6 [Daucus carota subsp. sativus]WOG93851.1 hypothetical protein DCAR_0313138 [Daucus carota subsp. sativus]